MAELADVAAAFGLHHSLEWLLRTDFPMPIVEYRDGAEVKMCSEATVAGVRPAASDVGDYTTMLKTIAVTTASLVALVVLGYFATKVLIKPISTDLSIVGQGKPVMVLAYENFSPASGEALERLRQVRNGYESRLAFVVADLGTPQGRAFANRFGLVDGQAAFMKPNGQPLRITGIPADEQELRARLDEKLEALE